MRERRKAGVWVVGQIADFRKTTMITYHEGGIYLIEAVSSPMGAKKRYTKVDFRSVVTWKLYPNDSREIDGKESGCVIREPTDEEFAMIAKQRLLGGENNHDDL